MGRPTVELDLDPAHARDLTAGGVFVKGCELRITEECNLLVRGAAGEMPLVARVVFVDPSGRGAGLEVVGFNPELRTRIAELAASSAAASVAAAPARARTPSIAPAAAPPRPRTPSMPPPAATAAPTARAPSSPSIPVAAPTPRASSSPSIPVAAPTPRAPSSPSIPVAAPTPRASSSPSIPVAAPRARTPSIAPVAAPAPAPETAAPPEPPPAIAIAVAVELEPEALDLQPEHFADVSAGSAFDIPADPSLGDLPTFELERELDLDAAPPASTPPTPEPQPDDIATAVDAPPFDPDATQPLSLEELAEPDTMQAEPDGDVTGNPADDAEDGADGDSAGHALRLHERMRGLTLVQQLKYAHTGELQERILLERIYGKTVWEALLRNPRLTAQEVARIARMGALPRPLLEHIVGNGAWIQVPEVRRALLTHPRLEPNQAIRILKLLPKHELKLAASQTVYPQTVREHARRLLKP